MNKLNGKIEDLTGLKYNRLTVIRFAGYTSRDKKLRWECLCDCGNKLLVRPSALKNNNTKSCGCLKTQTIKEVNCKKTGLASFNRTFRYYKKNSERRNLEFTLSEQEFKDISTQDCHYCKTPPTNFFKRYNDNGHFYFNGIDRVDNFEGYSIKNSVPCCTICNRAKSDMKYADFISYIQRFK